MSGEVESALMVNHKGHKGHKGHQEKILPRRRVKARKGKPEGYRSMASAAILVTRVISAVHRLFAHMHQETLVRLRAPLR
jgi:hypothetical protein